MYTFNLYRPYVILMFNVLFPLSEFSDVGMAGSSKDNTLADKIKTFWRNLHMKTWDDEHFVKLQYPNRSALFSLETAHNMIYASNEGVNERTSMIFAH